MVTADETQIVQLLWGDLWNSFIYSYSCFPRNGLMFTGLPVLQWENILSDVIYYLEEVVLLWNPDTLSNNFLLVRAKGQCSTLWLDCEKSLRTMGACCEAGSQIISGRYRCTSAHCPSISWPLGSQGAVQIGLESFVAIAAFVFWFCYPLSWFVYFNRLDTS